MSLKDAQARPRDFVWLIVAVIFAAAISVGVVTAVMDAVANGEVLSVGELVLGVILFAVVARWLIVGAWRRTVWGAPEDGLRAHIEGRSRA